MKPIILSGILLFICVQINAQTLTEIKSLVAKISIEVDSSRLILENENSKKIISYGLEAIPTLIEIFTDSKQTKVYSNCQERFLTIGEIAIILTDRIETMPYFTVTGIQNCTLEFCKNNPNLIEYYFQAIQSNSVHKFKDHYLAWFTSEERRSR